MANKGIAVIRCHTHQKYRGIRRQARRCKCETCDLIYTFAHQYLDNPDRYIGGLNPYQFVNNIDNACSGLEVRILALPL